MSIATVNCEGVIPGLQVTDVLAAADYYVNKLGFKLTFTWGDPTDMAGVSLGLAAIHLFQHQPQHSTGSAYFLIDDADKLFELHEANGVTIMEKPADKPYNMRDFHILDPWGNHLGFGHHIQHRGEPVHIERVAVPVRLEKRMAGVLTDLAEQKGMSIDSTLEETLLHTWEILGDGVASPHTMTTLHAIQALKKKHGLDYDCHASYRFVED